MKKGLESYSSIQIASLRIFITFLCLSPIGIHHIRKINRYNILNILIIGFFGSAIPAFLFPLSETRISSSLAGMLNSLSPVFTLLIGIIVYKRTAMKTQIVGVVLGLAGAIGLMYNGSFTFNYFGLFVILGTFLSGFSANEVSRLKFLNGLQITSLAFLIIGPLAGSYLIFSDFSMAIETEHWLRNLVFITILAVMGTAIAVALFYLLIRDTSPVFASMVTYFVPVVSTLWGLIDNERITSSILLSVVFILAGVYMINKFDLFAQREKKQR